MKPSFSKEKGGRGELPLVAPYARSQRHGPDWLIGKVSYRYGAYRLMNRQGHVLVTGISLGLKYFVMQDNNPE